MKYVYTENYKTLMKEIEKDTNKWKDILCSWTGRINIVKMSIWPKVIYSQCNPYQNSNGIFDRNRKNNLKICMEPQKTLNSQSNLEKEQTGDIKHPDFKLYYKVIVSRVLE